MCNVVCMSSELRMDDQTLESTSSQNDVHARLHEFGYYFVDSFEEQLRFYRNILEERPNAAVKPTSLPVTVTSGLANAIPTFGKPLSTGIQQGEKFMVKKIDKNRAITMAEIVYFHADVKEVVRDVLFSGIFDLFRCFEKQFMQVNANGGRTRAMQKLATDASHRFLMYLLENYKGGELTPDLVGKGVLNGDSQRHKLGIIKSGRSLMLEGTDESVTTSCLYNKVGVCVRNEQGFKYYRTKKTMTDLIGHRLLFEWENPEDIENSWIAEDTQFKYEYKLGLEDREEQVENVRVYVASKYPLEDLKEFNRLGFEEQKKLHEEASAERQENQSLIIEDSQAKHDQTILAVDQAQNAILETLKANQQELLRHTEEKFGEVKENVNDKHAEVVENLQVIRGELAETQGTICAAEEKLSKENNELKQEVSLLKDHKEDLDKNIVLKINRDEVRRVEETLKQLDPIRAIKESGEYKKLKKRWKF